MKCPVLFLNFLKKFLNKSRSNKKSNGEGGIRTHGTRQEFNGFQDRLLKPLGHPSRTELILTGNRIVVKKSTELKPVNSPSSPTVFQNDREFGYRNISFVTNINNLSEKIQKMADFFQNICYHIVLRDEVRHNYIIIR